MLLQREDFVAQRAALEVEDALGVEGLSHVTGLKVEMRPRGTPRGATVADELTRFDDVVGLDKIL